MPGTSKKHPCSGCGKDRVPVPRRELERLRLAASNSGTLASIVATLRHELAETKLELATLRKEKGPRL